MAAITGDFPTGPYSGTYNGQSIGLMEGPIRHQQSYIGLPIRASLWAQNTLDYIFQGCQMFAVITLKEWNTNTKLLMWPFNASHGLGLKSGELVGSGAYAKQLVLTALAGTPAATEGPATRTYPLAVLLPGHNIDVTLGPVERNVPVVLGILPEDATNVPRFFTDT